MGKTYNIMWQEKGGPTVKKVVRPQELIYRDSKDQIVECTEQFSADYVSNPNALTTIRYRVTGNDNDKGNDADSFRRVRIIGFGRDADSSDETEMKENKTLGRGKRIMKKKFTWTRWTHSL